MSRLRRPPPPPPGQPDVFYGCPITFTLRHNAFLRKVPHKAITLDKSTPISVFPGSFWGSSPNIKNISKCGNFDLFWKSVFVPSTKLRARYWHTWVCQTIYHRVEEITAEFLKNTRVGAHICKKFPTFYEVFSRKQIRFQSVFLRLW